jgi:RNA-directed DNA polymerase
VGRKIRDKAILKLIGKYLRAPMQRAEKKEARDKGTPQGGPLTPRTQKVTSSFSG